MTTRKRKPRLELLFTIVTSALRVAMSSAILACASAAVHPHVERAAPHLRAAVAEHATTGGEHASTAIPDPGTSAEVSLDGVLAFADQHSPVLTVARSTRSRAQAARVAASPLLSTNPQLTVAVGPRFGLAGNNVDVEASLTQQIQIAGERGTRMDAAERFVELTDAEIEQIRWFVHCDVHATFHRALVEQERMLLAQRVLAFQREVLSVVERHIAAGEAAALTLRLAQAEVAQAEQVLVAAQQAFFAARIRLAQLTGWPVATPPMPSGDVETPHAPPSQERLLAVALEQLPSLHLRRARVREAEARVTVADREAWMRPSLGVQYRHEGNPTSEGPYDVVLGVVILPIPSFQTNQGERALTRANVTMSEAELDAACQLLAGQVAEAHSEVVAAATRARAYGTEILPRFEENLTLLRRSFELGEIDILSLSAGRERFMRIQSDALSAQLDYFVALAGLERVVGVDLWHDHARDGATEGQE